ncbi:restriction endonuclease subunit S [Ruegeria marisrubri]|uniref:restriction endonuclease subunit S n=1 Tax=Ruegeria marisrubri TaxID=1685379 RepID=UPI001CD79633|nr:restriction endonuclease subunit S [Ruegeria marisrubri]MCA0907740.1 restriction endonuclease subunit S [Ruegeria marisrubri]
MLDQELRYESYKDSGVPWIGDVPADWQVLPGRACLYENKDKNTGMKEETVLSLSYGTVRVKPLEEQVGLMPESYETYQIVRPGDIIIRGTDLQNDVTSLRTGLAKNYGIITSAYINLRPRPNVSPYYLHYLLHSYDLMKVFYGLGSGLRQNLSYEDFKYMGITVPDLGTQNRIVSFLDEKTAEIDAAVAKKRRLIDLLNEQKAILINRAVTKGLNPDAPMKDSGVDWIGEIPAHWEVAKVKGIFDLLDNRRIPLSGEVRGSMTERTYDYYGASGIIDQVDDYIFDETTILIAEDGANLVMRNLPLAIIATGKYWVNNHAHILRPRDGDVHYWANALEAADYRPLISGAAQPKLTKDAIKNVFLPRPPSEEQAIISSWLEEIPKHFLPAEEATQKEISTLNEFKQTLIANAVTGKIKI